MPIAGARELHIGQFRVTLNRLNAFHVGLPVPGFIQEIFATQFKKRLQGNRMTYEHRLIDDMVAATPKWEDGFIWTRRNNDGEVQPDAVTPRFDSPEPVELAEGLAMRIGPEPSSFTAQKGLGKLGETLPGQIVPDTCTLSP
jgi:hypothetical protein